LATGLVAATIQPRVRDVALPSLAPLVVHAGWRIAHTYDRGGGNHFAFRQWTVHNQRGIQATGYLGATGDLKQMLRWNGELGYRGDGYQLGLRRSRLMILTNASRGRIDEAVMQRLDSRLAIAAAVLSPDGIQPEGTSNMLVDAWAALRGGH